MCVRDLSLKVRHSTFLPGLEVRMCQPRFPFPFNKLDVLVGRDVADLVDDLLHLMMYLL